MMAFIPKDATWYIGDIVLEYSIEDDARNVVHVNTFLVEAASPEDAYSKLIELGKSSEMDYCNSDGKKVTVTFRGLRDLNVMHEELKHGAELFYQEKVGISESEITDMLREKTKLAVFAPLEEKTTIPNYMPDSVMKELEAHLATKDELGHKKT